MESLKNFLEFKIINLENYHLSIYQTLMVVVVFLITKLLLSVAKKILDNAWRDKKLNKGGKQSLLQLISYFIWIGSIVLMLETVGIEITFLLAGSAALLVGLGLGLQQTFNDIISGIILLFEGSIRIGDVIEVEEKVVRVIAINLRTSEVIDRNDIVVIVPNSKIVTDKVINWSHNNEQTRFSITVGVAYGTDVELVIDLLEKSASEHPKCITKEHKPIARFIDFGDSALIFELFFWSDDLFPIEQTKSDIRRSINHKFNENKVLIPFPQRDLHMITSDLKFGKSE